MRLDGQEPIHWILVFLIDQPDVQDSTLVAFGMTKKSGRSAENDPGLSSLLNANTRSVCVVGKTWDYHVDIALKLLMKKI